MTGKIVRIIKDKGFGFIRSNNKEYFFHRSACFNLFDELEIDDSVSFEEGNPSKGLRAENVCLMNP